MIHKNYVFLLFALILTITLSGCTSVGKDNEIDTSNKNLTYKEIILSDILEEEYVSGIDLNSNNELVLCSEGDSRKYLVLDENIDVKKEINIEFDNRGDVFALDKNNNMYILLEMLERDENKEIVGTEMKLISYSNNSDSITEDNVIGELNDITARSTDEMTIKMEVNSKGSVYALKLKGSIDVYDNNLNLIRTIDSAEYKDIEIDEEDALLALHKSIDKKVLDKIDTSTFKTIWTKEYKSTDAPENIYYNKNTKSLYGINSYWIVKYDLEGNLTSRILNTGELSEIDFIVDFAVDDNEEVYLIAEVSENYKLIKYIKFEYEVDTNTVTDDDRTEVVIELNKDWDNFFNNAVKKFEKEHSHIDIKIKENTDLNGYQYREKLNAELMAEKGPDLLYFSSDDYIRTYIEKGILVNLDEMIKNDKSFNISDHNQRFIEMARYEENLYLMPIDYYFFYCFVLNEKLLNEKGVCLDDNMTWRDVYNLSEILNENSEEKIYVLPKIDDEILFDQLIWQDIDYYMDWNKKEAKFDSKEFLDTLELFKEIRDDSIMHPELTWEYILKEYDNLNMDLSNIAIYPGQTHAYHYISEFGSYFNDNFKAVSAPKGEYTGNRQFYSDLLGINANSEYKEEAWEFIKFILTDEIQITKDSEFHINIASNERQISEVFEFQETYKQQMERQKQYFAKEEDIEEVDRIIGNLNKLRTGDPFYDVIYEEIQPFLSGEKTAEEVAIQLQNKAEIYLLE